MDQPLRRITHGRPLFSAAIDRTAIVHVVAHRPRSETPEHSHERASLSLVLTGAFVERRPHESRTCGPLSVLFKPPGLSHASATGTGETRTTTLEIEHGALDPGLAGLERAVQVTLGPAATALLRITAALAGPEARARRRGGSGVDGGAVPELGAVDAAGAVNEALRALAAHAREIRLPAPDDAYARLSSGASLLRGPVPVRLAAARTGMHPVAFARAFRARFGCSPTEHRRRNLVATAANALLGTRGSLAAIAQDAGFADQAHLTRCFRREIGLTPGAYRALLAGCFRGS